MPETFAEYKTRIKSYMADEDPVEVLTRTAKEIPEAIRRADAAKLKEHPAGKWSISEIIGHLSDTEMVMGFRIRLVLGADNGVPVTGFDQDRWAEFSRYRDWTVEEALRPWEAVREKNLRLYRSLTPAQLEKWGQHSERGRETVREMLVLHAGHDLNHLKQIKERLG